MGGMEYQTFNFAEYVQYQIIRCWLHNSYMAFILAAGYSAPVTGKNAEERLDLRCAIKTDKFCK